MSASAGSNKAKNDFDVVCIEINSSGYALMTRKDAVDAGYIPTGDTKPYGAVLVGGKTVTEVSNPKDPEGPKRAVAAQPYEIYV